MLDYQTWMREGPLKSDVTSYFSSVHVDFSRSLCVIRIRRFVSDLAQQTCTADFSWTEATAGPYFTWILGSHFLITLDYRSWPVFRKEGFDRWHGKLGCMWRIPKGADQISTVHYECVLPSVCVHICACVRFWSIPNLLQLLSHPASLLSLASSCHSHHFRALSLSAIACGELDSHFASRLIIAHKSRFNLRDSLPHKALSCIKTTLSSIVVLCHQNNCACRKLLHSW